MCRRQFEMSCSHTRESSEFWQQQKSHDFYYGIMQDGGADRWGWNQQRHAHPTVTRLLVYDGVHDQRHDRRRPDAARFDGDED